MAARKKSTRKKSQGAHLEHPAEGKPPREKPGPKTAPRNKIGKVSSRGLEASYGPEVETRVIRFIREHGRMADAAEATGVAYSTLRSWINPNHKGYRPAFHTRYEAALEVFRDHLEAEMYRRGVIGVIEPVFQQGGLAGHKRVYSDRLLELMAKRHRPEFRESVNHEHHHDHSGGRALHPDVRVLIDILDAEGRRCLRVVMKQWDEYRKRVESGEVEQEASATLLGEGADVVDAEFEHEPRDVFGADRPLRGAKLDPRDIEALEAGGHVPDEEPSA